MKGPRRILIVHNAYQHRGGEDAVAEAETNLLRSRGHSVEVYTRNNDEIHTLSKPSLAVQTWWSTRTQNELAQLIRVCKPDVIHVHNTFPLISPSLYWAAHRVRIPIVQTLHNFRLLCPQAMFLREGRVCEDCLGRAPWRGIVHRCYRGSILQSGVVAAMLSAHRAIGTYAKKVTRYIALSEFSRRKFVEGGLPADRMSVKPNFVDGCIEQKEIRVGGVFVGRLSPEKGVEVLLRALDQVPGTKIDVLGVGPEQERTKSHNRVNYFGMQPANNVIERMCSASYLVLPSTCYESFPRTLVEAFSCGLPVIASRLGAMAELIVDFRTGLLFTPGSAKELAEKIAWAEANPLAMRQMGKMARAEYEAKYTPDINYRQLLAIYESVVRENQSARKID